MVKPLAGVVQFGLAHAAGAHLAPGLELLAAHQAAAHARCYQRDAAQVVAVQVVDGIAAAGMVALGYSRAVEAVERLVDGVAFGGGANLVEAADVGIVERAATLSETIAIGIIDVGLG